MKKIRTICLVFCFAAAMFAGCSPVRIKAGQVEKIVFTVSPKGSELWDDCSYQEFIFHGFKDTTVTDRAVIREFVRLVNRLTPATQFEIVRYRACAMLHLRDSSYYCVGLGESHGCTAGGFLMEDDPEIFSFIDRSFRKELPQ